MRSFSPGAVTTIVLLKSAPMTGWIANVTVVSAQSRVLPLDMSKTTTDNIP